MKKKFILNLLVIILFTLGCEKNASNDDSIKSLKDELNTIAQSKSLLPTIFEPCNDLNPYDAWGNAIFMGFTKITNKYSKNFEVVLKDSEKINELLKSHISMEYLKFDTTNVNLDNVKTILDEFLSLYINRNVFEAITLSKSMEDHLNNTNVLSNPDKTYLLKSISVIRYSSYLNYTLTNKESKGTKNRPFGQCWRESLQAIQDGGIIQRLACVFDWPVCLSIVAADCALEQIT